MTLFQAAGKLASMALTDADIERAKKARDRANFGGAVHQSWVRIVDALETAKLVQDGITEQGGQG